MTIFYFLAVGAAPLVLCFMAERFFFTYYMTRSEKRKNIIRNCKFLQPNFIGRLRYPMGIISIGILHLSQNTDFAGILISDKTAFYFWTLWMISDITDGTIARRYSLNTKAGETIDPLSDKLMQFPLILYLSYLGYANFWLVLVYVGVDSAGQLLRKLKTQQKANIFGKGKTFLVVILIAAVYSQHIFWGKLFFNPTNLLMVCVIFLAISSIFFRFVPNYQYGNVLSFTNFFCGIGGIVLVIVSKENIIYAFLLVFLGQFLDLYDGRAVRKWGGTLRGELYDDIADGTNFGGTISLIIFATVSNLYLAIFLMTIYFTFTVYRLYYFIINKRKENIAKTQAVEVFQGLPTPASASFVGSSLILLVKYQMIFSEKIILFLQAFIVIFASLLMVSKIPYIHFAQKILPKVSNTIKAISMIFIILLLLWSFDNMNFVYLIYFLFTCTMLYLVFGIEFSKKLTK